MNAFKFKCDCESKPRILLNRLNDVTEMPQLDKAVDQLVDSAWDDEDEEADKLLATFIRNLKTGTSTISGDRLRSLLNKNTDHGTPTVMFGSRLHHDDQPCQCRDVSHKLAIILNWGFAELNARENLDERSLADVLDRLAPFAEAFEQDRNLGCFLQRLWHCSIKTGKMNLISKLVDVYPKEINGALDEILADEVVDSDCLVENVHLVMLKSIVCDVNVFRHVSFYLAKTDSSLTNKVQVLLNAMLSYVKSVMSKHSYLDLYPAHLRPVVTILSAVINPDDPLVLNLLEKVKTENVLNFTILVTHFPLFLHLK